MPKFKKEEENLESQFEKWLYVLKNMPNLYDIPPKLQERIFKKLFRVSEIANFSKDEKADYEESLKNYRDLKGAITTAKDDGRKEGLKEGIEKGKQEGESKKTYEFIKNAINKGIDISVIIDFTGFTEEEVLKIIDKIKHEINKKPHKYYVELSMPRPLGAQKRFGERVVLIGNGKRPHN